MIDHGSDQNLIPPEFNRIYIPRDKPFSEIERLDFIKGICSSLLRYYDVGIFVDTDELIYLNDFNYEALMEHSPIHVTGFDTSVVEIAGKKRLVGIPVPFLCKASIFNKVPNWSIGFHGVVNLKLPAFFGVPMAHLKYISATELNARNESRASTYEKMNAYEKDCGVDKHWHEFKEDKFDFIRWCTDSIQSNDINDYKPLKSEGLYDKKILKEYIDSRETDFIYVPKTSLWDVSKITDLTKYFPHLIGKY